MTILLIDRDESVNPTDNSWVANTAAAKSPFWVNFDNVLAKRGYFPVLRKVSISLKIWKHNRNLSEPIINYLLAEDAVNTDALQTEVRGALLKMFSASIEAAIPLEITVDIDLPS